MSDVAQLRQLRPASPQLPVSWYFDAAIFDFLNAVLAAAP